MASDRIKDGVGFRLIIRSGTVSDLVKRAIMQGLEEIGKIYKDQIKKNVSLDDHTLQELRRLGYPYGSDKPENTPHDDRLVHTQTGKFLQSINISRVEEETSRVLSVYILSSDPVMPFLIYGTSKMRPRRFHEKSFEDIKDVFWDPVINRVKGMKYRITSIPG